ncbi:hypothetical protein OS493_013969 [Desmophyllum pertusum]|uniref:Cyclin-like domain-containing protein n=1 Tax=Desmophyllum pertusum TaxID=174260 RepID=A0A9X0CZU0_9CNID|nr:hypothetical protein OS493_013969 [Desmophyllum pertusum]
MYLQILDCETNTLLAQQAWNFMNDSFRTNIFVRYSPETIACACIFLSSRQLGISLPTRPPWWELFGAKLEDLEEISLTLLSLYTRPKANLDTLQKAVGEIRKDLAQKKSDKADGAAAANNSTPNLSPTGGTTAARDDSRTVQSPEQAAAVDLPSIVALGAVREAEVEADQEVTAYRSARPTISAEAGRKAATKAPTNKRLKETERDRQRSSNSQLRRCLDVFDLTSIGVGATVGAGLYVVTGQIARDVAGPGIVLSFFVAAVAAFLSGICYAEFGCRVVKAGSAYVYTYSSLGEIWAFIIGWNMILEYVIGTASLGRASSEYIDSIVGGGIRNFFIKNIGEFNASGLGTYPDFLAFVLVLLVSMIVASGAKHSAVFNKCVTVVNMLVILFVIAVGLFHVNPNNWAGRGQFLPYGVSGVLTGAASCFYCFVGFDVIATASEETINPKRSIPLSIMMCLVISFLAYFGVASILTLMVSYEKLDKFARYQRLSRQQVSPLPSISLPLEGCALWQDRS